MRRSCIVTAKRSCDTRSARRTRASTRSRPDTTTATIDSTSATAMPTRSTGSWRMPHRATLPIVSNGPGNPPAMAAPWAASTTTAMPVASQRGTRQTWTSTATATNSAPVAAPASGRTGRPGLGGAGQAAGGELAGDPGDERAGEDDRPQALHDRPGQDVASRARGPAAGGGRRPPRPRPGRRRCRCAARGRWRRRRRSRARPGPRSRTSATWAGRGRIVGDQVAQPDDDAAADEGGDVHAVGDLEPLQVTESTSPPGLPQLLDDARHAASNATPVPRPRTSGRESSQHGVWASPVSNSSACAPR